MIIRDATTGAFAASAAVNAHTNAYSVSNLVPGTYRAEFARDFGYDVAEAQFFDGKAEHLGVASSQTFTLAAGATRAGVSAVLVEGGRLTGRVRDTASNPVAGCVVTAYSSDGTRVGRDVPPLGSRRHVRRPRPHHRQLPAPPGRRRVRAHHLLLRRRRHGLTVGRERRCRVARPARPARPSRRTSSSVRPTRRRWSTTPCRRSATPPPTVGQTLTATTGAWTPSDGTYAYQWLAGGSPVPGRDDEQLHGGRR